MSDRILSSKLVVMSPELAAKAHELICTAVDSDCTLSYELERDLRQWLGDVANHRPAHETRACAGCERGLPLDGFGHHYGGISNTGPLAPYYLDLTVCTAQKAGDAKETVATPVIMNTNSTDYMRQCYLKDVSPHEIGHRWRTNPPPYPLDGDPNAIQVWHRECMSAVLDSLTAEGVMAWPGDGTSCVCQIIEAFARRAPKEVERK